MACGSTTPQPRAAIDGRPRPAVTGPKNWAIEDLTARGKTAMQMMLNRSGSSTLLLWLADHGRRGRVLADGHRGLRRGGSRTAGDGYQGHGWYGRHNTDVRNLPDYPGGTWRQILAVRRSA